MSGAEEALILLAIIIPVFLLWLYNKHMFLMKYISSWWCWWKWLWGPTVTLWLATELLVRMITKLVIILLCLKLQVPFYFPHDKNPLFDVASMAFQRGPCPLSPALPLPTLPRGSCTPVALNHHRSPCCRPTLSKEGVWTAETLNRHLDTHQQEGDNGGFRFQSKQLSPSSLPPGPHASLAVEAEPCRLAASSLSKQKSPWGLFWAGIPLGNRSPSRALEREAGTIRAARWNNSCLMLIKFLKRWIKYFT